LKGGEQISKMVEFMLCNEIKKEDVGKLGNDYIFEYKFDGLRGMLFIENHKIIKIINRRNVNILSQFPEFKELTFDMDKGIIDSEIIVVANGKDKGDFNSGLAYRSHLINKEEIEDRAEKLKAKIMAFDIISLNGEEVRFKPLSKRKEILKNAVKDSELIEVSKVYDNFRALWVIVERDKLEGLIAKNIASAYEGVRSKYWLKIKAWKETIIEFDDYEKAESEKNPFYKGIVLKNSENIRCSCLGKKSEEVKKIIEEQGSVKVVVQYLEKGSQGGHRFISFKELAR
jgi:ATP-dependent DNA ligase